MNTKLARIAEKAKTDRKLRFTSLAHLLTPAFLIETLEADESQGRERVDGETPRSFESELETRVDNCAPGFERNSTDHRQ